MLPLLRELVPSTVAVAEIVGDLPELALLTDEEQYIRTAVPRRQKEFAAGRNCARQALAQLGIRQTPIPRGEQGQPEWPSGIVGSITHCIGYVAAAVARKDEFVTLGIDAEHNQPLPSGVLDMVALDSERDWLSKQDETSTTCWDRLLFSIKESVYKAWFPLTGAWLGFSDARITVYPDTQEFHAELLVDPPCEITEFSGRFLAAEQFLVTAIAVTLPR